jgi:hypothetical protein
VHRAPGTLVPLRVRCAQGLCTLCFRSHLCELTKLGGYEWEGRPSWEILQHNLNWGWVCAPAWPTPPCGRTTRYAGEGTPSGSDAARSVIEAVM